MLRSRLARQRFLVGLRDAFEAMPELPFIRCLFGERLGSNPGTRTLLHDIKGPSEEACLDLGLNHEATKKTLDKALLPMRKAIGADADTYATLARFCSRTDMTFERSGFLAGFDILVDPTTTQIDSAVMATFQTKALENNTAPTQGATRGPRL